MDYEMEELMPVVGKIVRDYSGGESTSVTYETAEQLMEAVLYCIQKAEREAGDGLCLPEDMTAEKMYETGAACVKEKTRRALELYHQILAGFRSYGNLCLEETFVKGIPEFFKWYDIKFNPQDTILTLDYPVLKDLSEYTGIDKIYAFLICIRLEQDFLKLFPEWYVKDVLERYDPDHKEMVDNLCEILLLCMSGHALAGKGWNETEFTERDYLRIKGVLAGERAQEAEGRIKEVFKKFIQEHCESGGELAEYLSCAVDSVLVRIKNMAVNDALCRIL